MSELDTTIGDDHRPTPVPFSIPKDRLEQRHEAAALGGAAAADSSRSVVRITGQGAVTCMQGVLTNDVESHGERGFVYGALLSPKGMIQTDLWVARTPEALLSITPAAGREVALDLFSRYFPPRLARAAEHADETHVFEILGPDGADAVVRTGVTLPSRGSTAHAVIADTDCVLARPTAAPFELLVICARAYRDHVRSAVEQAGATLVPPETADLVRVLAGWPLLGAEIGVKTLPQEVRFDELDAVSYTKGCYTGQETVARVHFRGHANRWLAGLVWRKEPFLEDATITREGKVFGQVTSAVWSGTRQIWIGLGLVRREIAPGAGVTACGESAQVVRVPLPPA